MKKELTLKISRKVLILNDQGKSVEKTTIFKMKQIKIMVLLRLFLERKFFIVKNDAILAYHWSIKVYTGLPFVI